MAVVLPTFDELYAAGKSEVLSRQATLTDWREGSTLDALNGAGALLADEVIRVMVALFAKQFIDTATADDLDALALDRFQLSRNPASSAVGTLTFTRGTFVGDLAIPAGTQVSGTVNGVTVTVATNTLVTMPGAANTVDALATATVAGPTGNAAAGVLTTIVDTIPDDADATVTNAALFAGGAVSETDAAFRDRLRRYFTTLRKGTVAALEAGARTVPGVAFATVDETFMLPDDGGYVAVYVGDPDGNGNDALATAVETELVNWRSAGIWVQVLPAAREEVALTLTVRFKRGVDRGELDTALRAHILSYTDNLPAAATMYASGIEAAGHAASNMVVSVEGAVDATPTLRQNAIRVPAGSLSITLVEVA